MSFNPEGCSVPGETEITRERDEPDEWIREDSHLHQDSCGFVLMCVNINNARDV